LSQRCIWSLEDDTLALYPRSAILPGLWDRPGQTGQETIAMPSTDHLIYFTAGLIIAIKEP
jgi:hypothetical protein